MTLQGAGQTGGNVKSQWSSLGRTHFQSPCPDRQAPPSLTPSLFSFNFPPSSLPEEPDLGRRGAPRNSHADEAAKCCPNLLKGPSSALL